MTAHGASIDGMLRDFTRGLRSMTTIEAAGLALAALGAQFSMPELMITDVDAVYATPAVAVLFSARSLADLRAFATDRPLAEYPLFRHAWQTDVPIALSEARNELRLSEAELWAMLPPWSHGNEALTINVKIGEAPKLNFVFAGQAADVSASARSILQVASTMAVERLAEANSEGVDGPRLTKRERAILKLVAAGKSDGEVSAALDIAARTVRFHIENAKRKLGVNTRAQVVLMVLRGEIE